MLNVFQEKVKSFCVKNFAVSGKKSNFAEEKLCSTIKNVLFMKKIFTLIATAVFALTANAEVLINYSTSQDGITNGGTTTFDAVKINVNTVSTPCIKFANSYSTEGKVNDNKVALNVEGGFKAGDKITLAGYFNNADDTKQAAVEIFTINSDDTPNVLFTSQPFINGRTSSATATEESYILEADADVLYVGRKGNTAACVTLFKVVRGDEPTPPSSAAIDYPASQDGITNGGTTTFDAVKINVNTVSTPCIKFANSYSTEGKVNDNKVALNVEGGFKAGDKITLAGYFNNADDTKQAAVEIFTINSDDTPNVLFTSQPFINGRTSSATATEESYILEADADVLYVGRKGNTAACITLLKVTQATAVENVAEAKVAKTAPAKVLKNGQIFIGNYTVAGAQVK